MNRDAAGVIALPEVVTNEVPPECDSVVVLLAFRAGVRPDPPDRCGDAAPASVVVVARLAFRVGVRPSVASREDLSDHESDGSSLVPVNGRGENNASSCRLRAIPRIRNRMYQNAKTIATAGTSVPSTTATVLRHRTISPPTRRKTDARCCLTWNYPSHAGEQEQCSHWLPARWTFW